MASGAEINVLDDIGDTPVMAASRWHYADCVAEMLRLGADARRVNHDGETALHLVSWRGTDGENGAEVVRLLVAAGCDAAVRDNEGRTAVELAQMFAGDRWGAQVGGWIEAAIALHV